MSDPTLEQVQEWLDRYLDAWRSYDRGEIEALFTEDATYRHLPGDDPIVGRDAIVSDWLDDPDEVGSWTAHYRAWSVTGDRATAVGETDYSEYGKYYNVFLITLRDGKCSDFVEYWVRPRDTAT